MIDLHSCRQAENFTGTYRSNFIRMWEELLCEILKFINLLENILKYRYLDIFSFCTWDGELYFKYIQSNEPILGYQDIYLTFLNLLMNDDMNIHPCFFIAVDLKQGLPYSRWVFYYGATFKAPVPAPSIRKYLMVFEGPLSLTDNLYMP